jgi:hypothetical protein
MKDFPPIRNVKLTDEIISKLRNYFNWSSFCVGKAKVSLTKQGGVHYTGKSTLTNSISFEITRGGIYVMVSLFEYTNGVIFHAHIYYPQISKLQPDTIVKLYNEVKGLLEPKNNNDSITETYWDRFHQVLDIINKRKL